MRTQTWFAAFVLGLLGLTPRALAQLTFEGLAQYEQVNSYYAGGSGSAGSSGGPNLGVTIGGSGFVLTDFDAGGAGVFANEPSPSNVLCVIDYDAKVTADVPGGFTCFSFWYTQNQPSAFCHDDIAFMDANHIMIAQTFLDANTFAGPGDPGGGQAGRWHFKTITLSSTAYFMSLSRVSLCDNDVILYMDNMSFTCPGPCEVGPCSPCDLSYDGKLGYEDYSGFLCQLSGGGGGGLGCGRDCCGCADFNLDGDCGTDADIEAFMLCMEDPASLCDRASNDFCGNAADLHSNLGTFPLDTRYATGSYFGTLANPPAGYPMWCDVWFKWHAAQAGPTHVSSSMPYLPLIAVYTGTTCPVTAARRVVGSSNGVAAFNATLNGDYLIRIGSNSGTYGPDGGVGTFRIEQCFFPSGGSSITKDYYISGLPDNIKWSWLITSDEGSFFDLEDRNAGPVASSGTTLDLTDVFKASIDTAETNSSCHTGDVMTSDEAAGTNTALLTVTAAGPFTLWVGTAGTRATCAVVGGAICSFNPTIRQIVHSGHDCNGNGRDDAVDIAVGTSHDYNHDGIPDECQCGSADFNHDGDVGTDADIAAFFACLSGNCCANCGTADFNGDGDVGTDADIGSFFSVLGGGPC